MPARDVHHAAVRRALEHDGWTITHDPLSLRLGGRDFYVDLGAERLVAAERAGQRIAIEIKSFTGRSPVADLEQALGQFVLYRGVLRRVDPGRSLYLAVDAPTFGDLFATPIGRLLLDDERLQLLVFDPHREVIVEWISAR
jgi:hypothetical protein